jgi:hypothetical protein
MSVSMVLSLVVIALYVSVHFQVNPLEANGVVGAGSLRFQALTAPSGVAENPAGQTHHTPTRVPFAFRWCHRRATFVSN